MGLHARSGQVLWWPGQGVSTHGWPQEPPITLLHHCGGKAPRWEVINNLCLMERCLWVRIRASPASSKMPLAQHGCSDVGQVSLQKCHSPNPTQTQLSCISFFFFFFPKSVLCRFHPLDWLTPAAPAHTE